MIIKVLASGSKGNCTYLECGTLKVLIDAGISYLQIKKHLENIDIDINDINYLLITHIHSDHIKGLSTMISKTNIKLLLPFDLYKELDEVCKIKNYEIMEGAFQIDEMIIKWIPTSHDVVSYGFLIKHKDSELVYITDTGYINKRYYNILANKQIYVIEANHNEEKLMNGPYPYILKQRILSDRGHLSNKATGLFLSRVIGKNTKYVLLAHISEHNNEKELAFNEVKEYLNKVGFDSNNIIMADQDIALDAMEV